MMTAASHPAIMGYGDDDDDDDDGIITHIIGCQCVFIAAYHNSNFYIYYLFFLYRVLFKE